MRNGKDKREVSACLSRPCPNGGVQPVFLNEPAECATVLSGRVGGPGDVSAVGLEGGCQIFVLELGDGPGLRCAEGLGGVTVDRLERSGRPRQIGSADQPRRAPVDELTYHTFQLAAVARPP